jgi:hypothetical protein
MDGHGQFGHEVVSFCSSYLQQQLQADVYNLIPGSSKEYQLELLNNHNETGLMVVNIDLSSLTDTQRTITQDNPYLTVKDVSGTGAGNQEFYQYDLSSNNQSTIFASRYLIFPFFPNVLFFSFLL